ncbi:hypothetical protein RND81_14G129000 [Saponaria officinalis]|uniref:Disease resistance N-terminal domain-containing protein n=1 Tax=Saponaria officinalis TaxID=3572 RepID=A0AAW1GLT7_SAPOF
MFREIKISFLINYHNHESNRSPLLLSSLAQKLTKMDFGILLSVIQTLLAALDCSQLKDAWSFWGYKSDLDELSSIVVTVKKVLLDAEAKYDELSQETLHYVGELRDALYAADDLLDEFVTLAKQKQLMEDEHFIKKSIEKRGKVQILRQRERQMHSTLG